MILSSTTVCRFCQVYTHSAVQLLFSPRAASSCNLSAACRALRCVQVVQELDGASQPLQLSSNSLGANQPHQAAIDQLTSVSNLIVSLTGKWAAVTRACHVHVFDLENMSYHGRLPALQV